MRAAWFTAWSALRHHARRVPHRQFANTIDDLRALGVPDELAWLAASSAALCFTRREKGEGGRFRLRPVPRLP